MYEIFYNECSLMKDQYLHFQLKWHNPLWTFLLEHNQDLTTIGLHPSDPLAEKAVSVRAQWDRICIPFSLSYKEKKGCNAIFVCHVQLFFMTVSCGLTKTTEIFEEGKDACLRFGGYALAKMLQLRYDKMKKEKNVSKEITILQQINSYTKEHIPDYLKYRDNGHMHFPCPAIHNSC